MLDISEKKLYKPNKSVGISSNRRLSRKNEVISSFINMTYEVSESVMSTLPEIFTETYRLSKDVANNDFFIEKGYLKVALTKIEKKAKHYFGDQVSIQNKLNKDTGLHEVSLYNNHLTLEENYDRLDAFDTWWLTEGIEQFEDVVIYLR